MDDSPYLLNAQQQQSVSGLSAEKRYRYFVGRVADCGELWGLRDDGGWVMSGDGTGVQYFPVWPHPKFAETCARDEWNGNQPSRIELAAWMDRWLPGMAHDGKRVQVFPVVGCKGWLADPVGLKEDLGDELGKIE